jgi:hypothetical protein
MDKTSCIGEIKKRGLQMKRATIIINLVDEAKETPNTQIEKEIIEETKIPWMKDIASVHINT